MALRATKSSTRKDVALFVAFVLISLWCANGLWNVNAITRMGLARSLVHGTLNIDEVAPYTIDKAHWRGHYYCDKAPGISLLCLPAVVVADKAADLIGAPSGFTPARNRKTGLRYALAAFACLTSTSIISGALTLIVFRRTLVTVGASYRTAYAAALILGFGTPLLIWSTAIFGHATCTALLFIAFSLRWTGAPDRPFSAKRYAATGMLLSLATLVELTALPAAAIVAAHLMATDRPPPSIPVLVSRVFAILAGALPAGLILLLYNYLAFGSPFHLGYASVEGFEGMKSGFFGIALPSAEAFWGITLSAKRGILWLSPILLFSIPAFVSLLREPPEKAAAATCLGIAVYYLILNASYHYWDGGVSLGPRHITPIVPFLMFTIALWADRCGWKMRAAILSTGFLSMLTTVVSTSVTFRIDDDQPMFAAHLLPKLLQQKSDLVLTALHMPYYLLVLVPVVSAFATALLLLRPASFRDIRHSLFSPTAKIHVRP